MFVIYEKNTTLLLHNLVRVGRKESFATEAAAKAALTRTIRINEEVKGRLRASGVPVRGYKALIAENFAIVDREVFRETIEKKEQRMIRRRQANAMM